LEHGEIKNNPSTLVGMVFYWIIILNALIMASDVIDLKISSQFIQQSILYLPKIVVVMIFLALAMFISKFIYNIVEKTAHLANVPFHYLLATIARFATIGVAIMIILEYLDIAPLAMVEVFIVLFVGIPVLGFLIFLVAGRDLIASLLARGFLMKELRKGDSIEFDSVKGEVESIGYVATRLSRGNEEIIVPNAALVKTIIRKRSA
jgi:small-conductance mechanosensitive channel